MANEFKNMSEANTLTARTIENGFPCKVDLSSKTQQEVLSILEQEFKIFGTTQNPESLIETLKMVKKLPVNFLISSVEPVYPINVPEEAFQFNMRIDFKKNHSHIKCFVFILFKNRKHILCSSSLSDNSIEKKYIKALNQIEKMYNS